MRRKNSLMLAAALWLLAGCTWSCGKEEPEKPHCLDPNDPCPNDMVTEQGCTYDRCAGSFTGNLIPCFYIGDEHGPVWWFLAGARSQYLAYRTYNEGRLQGSETYPDHPYGSVWLYEIATGERRRISAEGAKAFYLRTAGSKVAWLEYVSFEVNPKTGGIRNLVTDVRVYDTETGQEWHVENTRGAEWADLGVSDRWAIFNERRSGYCENHNPYDVNDLWAYELSTNRLVKIDESDLDTVVLGYPRLDGDRVITTKLSPGVCKDENREMWFWQYDLASGAALRLRKPDAPLSPTSSDDRRMERDFEWPWFVARTSGTITAWNFETGAAFEITGCSRDDCNVVLGNGKVAYDRYGEDGLSQRQLYLFDLATWKKTRLTNLRPYYDGAGPGDLKANRLFWGERRGYDIFSCGYTRKATGVTPLWFWIDVY